MRNVDWMADARCAEALDPELFQDDERVAEARAFCGGCPAQQACLAFALSRPDVASHGVWGGKTARQRHRALGRRVVGARALPAPDEELEMDCA